MKTTQCGREQAILEAFAAGSWSQELRDHVAGCRSCSDGVLVAQALREAADDTSREPLPDPAKIWRAAQRDERLAAVERATWPIRLMVRFAAAACVVSVVASLVWLWPVITDQVATMAGWFTRRPAGGNGQVLATILALGSLATFSAAFSLFESWVRE
jgi:hypothetical protein